MPLQDSLCNHDAASLYPPWPFWCSKYIKKVPLPENTSWRSLVMRATTKPCSYIYIYMYVCMYIYIYILMTSLWLHNNNLKHRHIHTQHLTKIPVGSRLSTSSFAPLPFFPAFFAGAFFPFFPPAPPEKQKWALVCKQSCGSTLEKQLSSFTAITKQSTKTCTRSTCMKPNTYVNACLHIQNDRGQVINASTQCTSQTHLLHVCKCKNVGAHVSTRKFILFTDASRTFLYASWWCKHAFLVIIMMTQYSTTVHIDHICNNVSITTHTNIAHLVLAYLTTCQPQSQGDCAQQHPPVARVRATRLLQLAGEGDWFPGTPWPHTEVCTPLVLIEEQQARGEGAATCDGALATVAHTRSTMSQLEYIYSHLRSLMWFVNKKRLLLHHGQVAALLQHCCIMGRSLHCYSTAKPVLQHC